MPKEKLHIKQSNLPTFICIGGQRCGSTWLHKVIQEHPDIVMSPKEYSFFNLKLRTEGFEPYYACFEKNSAQDIAKARGDVTPTYSAMFPYEIELVSNLLPDLKIIYIIRNPVDRLISSITRGWTYSYVDKAAFKKTNIFALLRYVDTSLSYRLTDYSSAYKNWNRFFDADQILVRKYDDLTSNPKMLINDVLRFIDVGGRDVVLAEVLELKPNKSKNKEKIHPMLEWYLAVKWLPKIKDLQSEITELDFSNWIESLEKSRSRVKFSWLLIRVVHLLYFSIPYRATYHIFNVFRSLLRKSELRRIIKNLSEA